MRRLLALLSLLCITGCATAGAGGEPGASQPASPGPPSTALDPPPYTPPPSAAAPTTSDGLPVGLRTSGSEERARILAIRFIRAVRDADTAELERALDDRVARLQPRLGRPARPREAVIEQALHHPRRRGFDPALGLDEIIQVELARVRPIAEMAGAGGVPVGLSPSDLLVTVPLRPLGRRHLRHLIPGWNQTASVLIRPGSPSRIVGL